MDHIAIDLGGRESQLCVRRPDGSIVEERRHLTRQLPKLLTQYPPSRVILETSSEAFRIADAAMAAGHQIRVVSATLVKTLGVGSRGVKNDQKDARVLSEVSCQIDLPSVHIPSAAARALRSMSGSREVLVEIRTKAINNVRGWMRTQLIRIPSGTPATFPTRLRAHVVAQQVSLPTHIERALVVIETLNVQIKEADRELRQLAKDDPVCQRLMSVPGIGPVTAVRFRAAIDRIERFAGAHAVQSYLGLTPGENSSSERKRLTGITKAGPTAVRWTLIQAAWVVWRQRPTDPMVQWAQRIAARRNKPIAIVAHALKLAGILFALWRDGTTYDPKRGSQPLL